MSSDHAHFAKKSKKEQKRFEEEQKQREAEAQLDQGGDKPTAPP